MDDDARHLLPAYAAGTLCPELRARVEHAVQGSPPLLAETLELMLVNDRLLQVRAELHSEVRRTDAERAGHRSP